MIKEARHYRFTKLNLQYYLMHYLMVDFVVCDLSNEFEYERFDRFQLLEKTLNKLEYKSRKYLKNLSNEFNRIYFGIYQNLFFKHKNTEEKHNTAHQRPYRRMRLSGKHLPGSYDAAGSGSSLPLGASASHLLTGYFHLHCLWYSF